MTKMMMNDMNKEKDDSVVPPSSSSCCIGRGSSAILSYDGTELVPFRPVTAIVGIVAVVIILL